MEVNKKVIFIAMLSLSMYIQPSMRKVSKPLISMSDAIRKYPKAVFYFWGQHQEDAVNKDMECEEVSLPEELQKLQNFAASLSVKYEKKGDKQVGAQPVVASTSKKLGLPFVIDWNKAFYPVTREIGRAHV